MFSENPWISFRSMKTVSNILVAEFLNDVHVTCNKCSEQDWTPLQKYLLKGRGCVILQVLYTIGLQVNPSKLLTKTYPWHHFNGR